MGLGLYGTVSQITKADGTVQIPVATTAVIYTPIFELHAGWAFGVQAKATVVSGTPDIKIELEHCMTAPTYEAADTANAVIPDGFSAVITLTDELVHIKALSPVAAKYGRFKLTGQGSNPATATVAIKVFRQESA